MPWVTSPTHSQTRRRGSRRNNIRLSGLLLLLLTWTSSAFAIDCSPKLQVSGPVKEVGVAGRILLDNILNVVGLLRLPEFLAGREVLELRMGSGSAKGVPCGLWVGEEM